MKFAIVADSGCDLVINPEIINNDTYTQRVPLKLRIGEKEFVDDESLDIKKFVEEMHASSEATGSAAPSPQEWYDAYAQADYAFAITLTGSMSGSYRSAVAAKDMLSEDKPEKKVHVIDSLPAGPGLTMIFRKLQELIASGLSFEDIVEQITAYKKNTHLLFILESMDNLVKNGRVSPLVGKLAGMLGIKILGTASENGELEVVHKCRGKDAVYKKLVTEMLNNSYKGGKVIISHCFSKEKVDLIVNMIKEHFPNAIFEIMPTSGLCSYYAEENGILLAYEA